jgi:predicted ATPase
LELDAALKTAAELVRRGEEREDLRAATLGHRALGVALTHLARLAEGQRHLEQAIAFGSRAGTGSFVDHVYDPVITSRPYLARCLLHAGYPDQHERLITRTIDEAERSGHAPGLGFVLFQAAELDVECRDPRAARARLDRLIPLARVGSFALWQAMARAIDGWIMAEEGEHTGACAMIRDGLSTYEAQDVVLMRPFLLSMLGAALGRAGRPDQALPVVDAGIQLVEEKGETIWEPELHRLKGDILLACSGSRRPEAEASYARAIRVARGQGAKLSEVRAATGLARLRQQEGRDAEAHDVLAPIYGWFTEGFDTADLKDARALLDELG